MRLRGRRVLICSTLWLVSSGTGLASDSPEGPVAVQAELDGQALHLRSGIVDLRQRPSLLNDNVPIGQDRYVLQLDGPIDAHRRGALVAAGVSLGEYLPMHAYVVRAAGVRPSDLAALGFVRWVGPFDADWKIAPQIGTYVPVADDRKAMAAQGTVRLVVALFPGADVNAAVLAIGARGGVVLNSSTSGGAVQMEVDVPLTAVGRLAEIEDVQFVDEVDEAAPRNGTATWIGQTNILNSTPFWDLALDGTGEIVGVMDWFLRTDHCCFVDLVNPIGPLHRKIQAYYNQGPGGGGNDYHGTIVCGVFFGNAPGQANPDYKGMANNARVVFQHIGYSPNLFVTSTNIGERLLVAHSDGARVHNMSFGGSFTTYTARSRDVDEFMRNNEDDVVLVAITNSGPLGNPDNAKNCVSVAAAGDTPGQANYCSGGTGPTADGRRKPDLMHVGCGVNTSSNTAGTCDLTAGASGTSYASPGVAGLAVITRQYFRSGFYPTGAATPANSFMPSGALLKATLLNSAVDMTGIAGYPGNQEGWGRILLDDTLYRAGDARKLMVYDVRNASGLSTGQSTNYAVSVLSNSQPLKVTLVWTDVPAVLNAAFTPINNLDLTVTDPSANVYRGNVFSAGQSATGGAADNLNNVEQVLRTSPSTGTYTIQVAGTAVNQLTQGYALVISGDVPGDVLNCSLSPKGDVNGDSLVNGSDVLPFVNEVLTFGGTITTLAECAADVGSSANTCTPDDLLNSDDVPGFVALLLDGSCP